MYVDKYLFNFVLFNSIDTESSGDIYDNDWLNVYNETSSDSEVICDETKCEKQGDEGK